MSLAPTTPEQKLDSARFYFAEADRDLAIAERYAAQGEHGMSAHTLSMARRLMQHGEKLMYQAFAAEAREDLADWQAAIDPMQPPPEPLRLPREYQDGVEAGDLAFFQPCQQ